MKLKKQIKNLIRRLQGKSVAKPIENTRPFINFDFGDKDNLSFYVNSTIGALRLEESPVMSINCDNC